MQDYINKLITWCDAHKLSPNIETETHSRTLSDIHRDLTILHCDYSKIRAVWIRDKNYGGIRISSPDWIRKLNTEHTNQQYSDADIINSGYNKNWWIENISIFRSLYQFHEEGNGDGLYIHQQNGIIYFLAHDWMDWISKDPPMFQVVKSLPDLYSSWSKIGFAWPRSSYWMNTYKNGKFTGFNNIGFGVI
jgi:hypothetical protein